MSSVVMGSFGDGVAALAYVYLVDFFVYLILRSLWQKKGSVDFRNLN